MPALTQPQPPICQVQPGEAEQLKNNPSPWPVLNRPLWSCGCSDKITIIYENDIFPSTEVIRQNVNDANSFGIRWPKFPFWLFKIWLTFFILSKLGFFIIPKLVWLSSIHTLFKSSTTAAMLSGKSGYQTTIRLTF